MVLNDGGVFLFVHGSVPSEVEREGGWMSVPGMCWLSCWAENGFLSFIKIWSNLCDFEEGDLRSKECF